MFTGADLFLFKVGPMLNLNIHIVSIKNTTLLPHNSILKDHVKNDAMYYI